MIKQAQDEYKPVDLENRVQAFWRRAKVYEKTVAARAKADDYYFVDGPPYTTGSIHLGQVLNKTVKDAVVRWQRMRGRNVRDQPGYDMHGLPIEVQVEKTLGITNKKEIEELGIERFVTTCREFSLDLLKKMNVQFQRLGVWMDWERPYMTIRNDYIEAAWWTFKRAHERGLLYEALRSLQWCSRCETALADAEVEYEDETDPSLYVKFPLRDAPDASLLIWTTTPWTLPANMAIAVHPDFTYAKVRVTHVGATEFVWLLESTVPDVMEQAGVSAHEIVERKPGKDLVGLAYTHPLDGKVPYQAHVSGEWVHRVVPSEIVEAERTGLVHTAPGHGPEDFDLGARHGLEPFSPVDERGRFTDQAGAYAGKHVKEANYAIIEDLKAVRALFIEDDVTHSYGHCWRCKTPVLFRATVQWFLKITDLKPKMLEEIRRVSWYPEWAGAARQMDWTQNLRDWCLSRQRYWGIPLPIWRCTSCAVWTVVGSAAELRRGRGYSDGMDLHRPWIDAVILPCEACGREMSRIKDVLDVWFDSGVAGWASLGYPARDEAFNRWWPIDWIVEGPDQTRGWFNSQLAAGVVAFDRAPYDAVMMHGWVNGPDGRQMHKSLGNFIEPDVVIDKFGVDALRFYVLAVNPPWDDITFQEEGVKTAGKTLNILWNVLRFATTYMSLDRYDPETGGLAVLQGHLRPEDRWLLSRLEGVKAAMEREMAGYHLHRAFRAVESFILDDLSRWYVKLVRDRTWSEAEDRSKWSAYAVLHEALTTTAALLAPAAPHLAEAMYQHLDGRRLSVHMVDWPAPQAARADEPLERSMAIVQELVESLAKERQKRGRKLRWPVRLVAVKGATAETAKALTDLRDVFLAQANAKDVVLMRPADEFPGMVLVLKPDANAIGKAYRALLPKIAMVLESRSAEEVRKALEKGHYKLGIEGQTVTIEPSMVSFTKKMPADVAAIPTRHGELVVDLRMTPEIQADGYGREVIRRVQQMRKEINLEVDDFIVTTLKAGRDLAAALASRKEDIARETRSRTLSFVERPVEAEYVVEWNDVDGQSVTIGITPLHATEALREFTRIQGVTATKAMALFDAGYRSIAALRAATRQELAAIERLEPGDADRILDAMRAPFEPSVACAACEAPLPKLARRCPRCEAPATSDVVPCPRCHSPVPPGSEACGVCGFSLGVTSTGEPTSPRKGCVACGALIPADAATCPSCGVSQAAGPAPTADATGSPVPSTSGLRDSSTYLVKEAQPDETYRLFGEAVRAGRKGLCVTRVYPQKIREKYGLTDLPVLWLSNVGKEDAVRPKDLEKLSLAIEQFLARERGVLVIDGIEYLITNNNFITVLRFVQAIRDQVAIHGALLLFSVNPSTLDTHQLTLLEREVDAVIDVKAAPSGSARAG